MTSHQITFPLSSLKISIALLMMSASVQSAMAEDTNHNHDRPIAIANTENHPPSATLEGISIVATKENKDIATTTVTSEDIKEQQINSQKDLVRYNPEISVAEVGRYGSKGFAIRGVEGNRVAIAVDGMAIPDIEVNELFTPYGYTNNSRFSGDVELMQGIELKTGADGVTSGSGSLGGAVNYQTKDPEDFLLGQQIGDIDIGGYTKIGHTSKNEETMTAVGLAAASEKLEGMVNYVYRNGHQLKNHKMRKFDKDRLSITHIFPKDEVGAGGIFPDPSHYENEAILGKVYFQPTDEHRVGINASFEERVNQNYAITKNTLPGQRRLAWDKNQRESYGLSYEYTPIDTNLLDYIKTNYQHQEVMSLGDTFTHYEDFSEDEKYNLSFNEYRPTYQDTDQLTVDVKSQPYNFQFMPKVDHTFSTMVTYSQQDYDPYLMTKGISNNAIDYKFIKIVSPDVETENYSVAIKDDIQLNDKARLDIGVRYDNYTRKPYFHPYKERQVAKMGDGSMLKSLYNTGAFDKDTTFDNVGWSLLGEYQLNPQWQGQYKVSTGFLVPSINQMYSAFCFLGNCQKPNINLQPETSINHELAFTGKFDHGAFRLRGFYSKYDDFIDSINYNGKLPSGTHSNLLESINIDSAETQGIGIGGDVYLDSLFDTEDSITLTGQINYASDSTSKGTNLLATQPLTGVLGLDYISADDKYSLHTKLTYLGKKKADDSKKLEYDFANDKYYVESFIESNGLEDKLSSATLLDVYGSVKLREGVRFNAGVYNLLDEKYIPWDNVRQLSTVGINNMVKGDGIWRYSAPGTNYGVSLTFEY